MASLSDALLPTSSPSVSRTTTRPPCWLASRRAERSTASHSAVPEFAPTASVRSVLSASIVEVENAPSCEACWPKVTSATRSQAGFAATKAVAAVAASTSGFPAIEREVSSASTTFLQRPRLTACSPTTRCPFSNRLGCVDENAEVTTVVRTCGYAPKSTPLSLTPALAVPVVVASAARPVTNPSRKTPLFRLIESSRTRRSSCRRSQPAPR